MVIEISNSVWANRYPADTLLIDVFAELDRHIANSIQRILHSAFQHRV